MRDTVPMATSAMLRSRGPFTFGAPAGVMLLAVRTCMSSRSTRAIRSTAISAATRSTSTPRPSRRVLPRPRSRQLVQPRRPRPQSRTIALHHLGHEQARPVDKQARSFSIERSGSPSWVVAVVGEALGVGYRQRRDPPDGLAGYPEYLATGREVPQMGASS